MKYPVLADAHTHAHISKTFRKEGHPHLERDDNIEGNRLIITILQIYTGKAVRDRKT